MTSYFMEPVVRDAERTPEDWRKLLLDRLMVQAGLAAGYDAYYDGRHPLLFATAKFREAFGSLFAALADNWCQIVVDAPVERLQIVGFQVDGQPSDQAWEIWQDNTLDVESVIAHTEAGKHGQAFLLVDPADGDPKITVEHAGEVIVAVDPGDRRTRQAALKRWIGDDGYIYVNLYLPDAILNWESAEPLTSDDEYTLGQVEYVSRNGGIGANPFGVVPVIPLENKPSLIGRGHSDLEPAIPLQNAVNKLCSDMLISSEYGAFPARVITGVEMVVDPDTGRKIYAGNKMEAALSRFIGLENPSAGAISLPAADLKNFVNAIEMFIQHLAAQTRTPPHYLLGQVVNASGDALQVAEAGLTSKCKAKILFFSDAWEEALALALTAAGTDTDRADCEAVWANPERVTVAALVDAAVKKKSLGIPLPVIWLELGYTPEQIAEMEALEESKREELLATAATAEAAAERVTAPAPVEPGLAPPPGATATVSSTVTPPRPSQTPAPPAPPAP